MDPGSLAEAIEDYRPRRRSRVRPPAPSGGGDPDPLGSIQRRVADEQRRCRSGAESRLQGAEEVDLTGLLCGMDWPLAAQELVALLGLSADPRQPFTVELGQMLLIDATAPVTYAHPVTLRRSGNGSTETADGDGTAFRADNAAQATDAGLRP